MSYLKLKSWFCFLAGVNGPELFKYRQQNPSITTLIMYLLKLQSETEIKIDDFLPETKQINDATSYSEEQKRLQFFVKTYEEYKNTKTRATLLHYLQCIANYTQNNQISYGS